MAIDTTRAAFVQNEFRYEVQEDATVKTNYPNAEEYVLDTQLSASAAATLASALLTAWKTPGKLIEVEINEIMWGANFAGQLPAYYATFPELGVAATFVRVISAKSNFLSGRTTLVLRA